MAKMFYTTEEASQKLGVSGDQLKTLVTENKLREFRDGARVMFKVDQVDKLVNDRKAGTAAGAKPGKAGEISLADSGIGLAGDSHASDVISLADSTASPTAKDDTVVTTGKQQVFKPGEVKAADTGAQTHIEGAIDDQLSLEGVGSGSGLLDLTRESDDTSLGAELLDEIYPGDTGKGDSGIGSASGIFVEKPTSGSTAGGETSGPSGLDNIAQTASAPVVVAEVGEPADAMSGAFGGVAFASVIISVVTLVIGLSFFYGSVPSWLKMVTDGGFIYALIFGGALLVVTVIFALVGMAVGKAR